MAAKGADAGYRSRRKSAEVAKLHKHESGTSVQYRLVSAETLADGRPGSTTSSPHGVVDTFPIRRRSWLRAVSWQSPAARRVLTINATKSYLFAVIGASTCCSCCQRDHDRQIIQPAELARSPVAALAPTSMIALTYNPLTKVYRLLPDTSVNYVMAQGTND
jgi:2-polyprenyl-6-hydroxyphenyl methylase/3-demethylubiquinone-9 3-methyltransferase